MTSKRIWTGDDLLAMALKATGMTRERWVSLMKTMQSDAEMNLVMKAEWNAAPRDSEAAIRDYYRKSDIWFVNTFCHGVGALLKIANREPVEWQDWHVRFSAGLPEKAAILDYGGGFFNDTWAFVRKGYTVHQAEVSGPVTEFLKAFKEATEIENIGILPVDSERPLVDKYDGICCFETLEHLLTPVPFTQHLVDHLNEEGRIAMSVSFGAPEHAPYHVASNAPLSDVRVWQAHLKEMGLFEVWRAVDSHRNIWGKHS